MFSITNRARVNKLLNELKDVAPIFTYLQSAVSVIIVILVVSLLLFFH